MRMLAPITFASILLVSACNGSPENKVEADASTVASTSTTHNYRCESGEAIATTYPTTDSATVQYKGSVHKMQIAVSGSGARYVGDDMEWWSKGSGAGSEGTLFHHNADGTSGETIELCKGI